MGIVEVEDDRWTALVPSIRDVFVGSVLTIDVLGDLILAGSRDKVRRNPSGVGIIWAYGGTNWHQWKPGREVKDPSVSILFRSVSDPLIQNYIPEHWSFRCAPKNNFESPNQGP